VKRGERERDFAIFYLNSLDFAANQRVRSIDSSSRRKAERCKITTKETNCKKSRGEMLFRGQKNCFGFERERRNDWLL